MREDEALHLAGGGDGDLVDDLDALGPQALGHVALPQVGDEIVLGGRRGGVARYDEGADALAEARVGHADGGRVGQPRRADEVVVDLPGRDVLAAADDDLLLAPVDADAPLLIHVAQVAAIEPSLVVQRAVGAVALVQIPHEHVRARGRSPRPGRPGAPRCLPRR